MARSQASGPAETPSGLRVGLYSPSALFLAAVAGWLRHDRELDLEVVAPVLDDGGTATGPGTGAEGIDVVVLDGQVLPQFLVGAATMPRVVVVARPGQPLPMVALLAGGVRGFVLAESCTGHILTAAVRAAAGGHVFVQDDVDRLWRSGDGAGPGGVPQDLLCLTDRERQVWRLLATGRSNRQIARALDVSERTVRFHLTNVFHKLRVQSRAEAIGMAFRLGAA